MTSAVLGSGAILTVGAAAIAEVLRCSPIGGTNPEVDVTNLDSTAKEYIAGLSDGNTMDFDVNWIAGDTEQELLRTAQAAGSTVSMVMTWPDTTVATFSLVMLSFEIGETTPEAQITATFSGRITGAIAWT